MSAGKRRARQAARRGHPTDPTTIDDVVAVLFGQPPEGKHRVALMGDYEGRSWVQLLAHGKEWRSEVPDGPLDALGQDPCPECGRPVGDL